MTPLTTIKRGGCLGGFERGLGPRNRVYGGRFGRGAKSPSEEKQRFQRKPIVLPVILEV